MRPLGYSTGALARGSVHEALQLLAPMHLSAVEVSALRSHELGPLVAEFDQLLLATYSHVTVHLPSRYEPHEEPKVVEAALGLTDRGIPVVIHPDAISNYTLWQPLGDMLLVENMDKRKPIGRTLAELMSVLEQLPDARICFDVGHALQVDPSLVESLRIIEGLGDRFAWMHLSEVSSSSKHERMSFGALLAFQWLAPFLPSGVPAVIEAAVSGAEEMEGELRAMHEVMNKAAFQFHTEAFA